MNIQNFSTKYETKARPIKELVIKWVTEKKVDDFLGTKLMGGLLIADFMKGGSLLDEIPPEVKDGFKNLMGDKADTLAEVRQHIIDKISKGDKSVNGLMNKIQGQLGEDQFEKVAGSVAKLAESGGQEGYDVIVNRGNATEYIQVKVYKTPGQVIETIQEVNEKTVLGEILGDTGEKVRNINFAVNSDIYEEVSEKVKELGLENKIYDIKATRDQIRGALEEGFYNVENPMENFFSELLGGAVTGAALHALVNGFLVWKGAKERGSAIEDTLYSTATTSGGLLGSFTAEAILFAELEGVLAILTAPIGGVFVMGVGMGTRALLKRFFDRRFLVERLINGNSRLEELYAKFNVA